MSKIIVKNESLIKELVLFGGIYKNIKEWKFKDFKDQNIIKIVDNNFEKELEEKYDFYQLFVEPDDNDINIKETGWFTIEFPVDIDFKFNSNNSCFFEIKNNKVIVNMSMHNYIGWGISLPLNSVMKARYFGRKAFGSIQGTSMMLITPAGAVAPIYAGWVYDTTGSYITAFAVFAALLAFSAVLMSLAFPPKPPARITDVREFL